MSNFQLNRLPKFAYKPNDSRGEVFATSRGWEIETKSGRTEILRGIRGLDKLLEDLIKKLLPDVSLEKAVEIDMEIHRTTDEKRLLELREMLFRRKRGRPVGVIPVNKSLEEKLAERKAERAEQKKKGNKKGKKKGKKKTSTKKTVSGKKTGVIAGLMDKLSK